MLTSLDFGQGCVTIIRTLFSCSSSFVSVNNFLSLCIHIYRLIRLRSPLAPYLYVLTANALGYLLEATLHQGKIRRVSFLRENEMVNNHFIYVSIISMTIQRKYFSTSMYCLIFFTRHLGLLLVNTRLIIGLLVLIIYLNGFLQPLGSFFNLVLLLDILVSSLESIILLFLCGVGALRGCNENFSFGNIQT
jgi:hypothetical protein